MNDTSRRWAAAVAYFATWHLFLLYGLPFGLFALLFLALGFYYYRAGPLAALTTTISLGIATGLYALFIKVAALEDGIYYRPQERFTAFDYEKRHRSYRKNVTFSMTMPFGDLQAMTTEKLDRQSRHVVFITDAEGYRNAAAYAGQPYLLDGDSYVAGVSNSQEDILSSQLKRDYGIDAYSIGHPGDINDYERYLRAFRKKHGDGSRALLFLFEGNDFPEKPDDEDPSDLELWLKRYYDMFSETAVFRVTKVYYKRATRFLAVSKSPVVETHKLGNVRMAFHTPYIEVSRRAEYIIPAAIENDLAAMSPHVRAIFFIPTKYRVYAKHIGAAKPLPDAQWDTLNRLCARHGWRCVNLTPDLIAESDRLLAEGKYTYWIDDSHWNRYGIAVAARAVARTLTGPAAASPQ